MGFRMAMDLTDLLTFWDPYYWRTGRQRRERGESMSFIESIFSFVFGDGDPNESFEERRWRALAAAISARDGVVAAEEIAPYLDPPAGAAAAAAGGRGGYVDESYVLPALIKLGGESFVSDDGHLLYRFPSLQATTSRKQQRKAASAAASSSAVVGAVPQEATWSLTAASGGQQIGTVLLGVANVVGVLVLSSFAADPQYRVVLMREGMGWVLGALPALQAYAAAFFLIPAVRAVLNARANAAIQRRNDARQQAAQLLRTAASVPMMVAKLRAAREAAAASGGVRELKSQDAVFSSERETGKQVNSFDLEEWDRKMQERGGGGR